MLIKKDPATIKSYFEDSSNLKGGYAEEVAFPENESELSSILKDANRKKIPVTVSGGGTGTTGSRIPFGGIVISFEKFNRIYDISTVDMSAKAQAGVPVEELKDACEKKRLFYTSHPTEKSAFVGGTVATNASGARSFKYGPTRKYVKRLKMILSDGEVFEIGRGERFISRKDPCLRLKSGREIVIPIPAYNMPQVKSAAGYFAKDGMDLIDLFIGQEGTLSVITDLELGLVKMPDKIFSAFVFFKKEEDAWDFADEVRAVSKGAAGDGSFPGALSVEYFDNNALNLLRAKNPNVAGTARSAIFFEQEMNEAVKESLIMDRWFNMISKHNASLDDTWAAMSDDDARKFTRMRYSIPESLGEIFRQRGYQKLATDIAVPVNGFREMMRTYVSALSGSGIEHVIFGHIGECHVHVNLLSKTDDELVRAKEIYVSFITKAVALGGTVSAEHGIGKTKHKYLEIMYGKSGIMDMARLKKAFDPGCVLGLDNIFPKELLEQV